jgi:hypothetical protein
VLRWTFRREDEAVVCELGLNKDDSAYELRLQSPDNNAAAVVEVFDDVTSAFERHAVVERMLVSEGWLLEAFDSELVAR